MQQTVQRHAKKRLAPDCKRCGAEDQARFNACMEKLVLGHHLCNKEISDHLAQGNTGSAA